jgi:hypothetical protein
MSSELRLRRGNQASHDGFTGAVGEVTFNTETKALHVHDGVTAGGFAGGGCLAPFTGAQLRAQADKNAESVSVKDFGAVGDGTLHTVAEWIPSRYANLAAVQADYPHVTGSTDSIDWAACQAALNSNANKIYAPSGTYVLSAPLKTKHTGSYYRRDTAQTFFGDGFKTLFTRNVVTAATRVSSSATTAEKLACDQANALEACIAITGSNNDFYGFAVKDSAVGIYLGQDYNIVEDSSVCHNTFDKILIQDCGNGLISACANGNHYNDFNRIHFVQCQIDAHFKNGGRWTGSNNNNRNTFYKIRSARSRVGLWIESGDSNVLYSWHGEGCGVAATGNRYANPAFLPNAMDTCVHIIGGQLNRVYNSQMEDCDIELYNYGYNNEYYGNGYHDGVSGGLQVINATPPAKWMSQFTLYAGGLAILSNPNQLAFPDLAAGAPTFTGNLLRQYNKEIEHKNPAHLVTNRREEMFELGAIAQNTGVNVTIWADAASFASLAATFKITVVGVSTASNLSFSATFVASALRTSSRVLSRYFAVAGTSVRATGTNVGDSSEPITADLTTANSNKDLVLIVKAPQFRDLAAVSVHVERLVTKP